MQDAHNHLQDCRFDRIRDRVVAEMRQAGIRRCVVNGTSPADWPRVAALAHSHPDLIIPSYGLHPWKPVPDGWLNELNRLLDASPHAGIGECGLDRWMPDYDLGLQSEIFTTHLQLAVERNRPLSIHCLKAWGHLVDLLECQPLPERGFLLHSYGGSAELVPRLVKLGAYFSFSGYFLHARKQNVRAAFRAVPPDRLLLETDAPDMLPPESAISHVLPDNLNHPANLAGIAAQLGTWLDTSLIEDNFDRFFTV